MSRPELSCDLGEAITPDELETEAKLWALVDFANVACGGHVGDEESMTRAAEMARLHGVRLGAHPSYPDREGFGRRRVEIGLHALERSLIAQLDSIASVGASHSLTIERIKPHGQLYHDVAESRQLASVLASVVQRYPGCAIVAGEGSAVAAEARDAGVEIVREAFVDRRYAPDGGLQPRSEPGALLREISEAVSQARSLIEGGTVTASDGTVLEVAYDTLCAHGDMEGAVARIAAIRELIDESVPRSR